MQIGSYEIQAKEFASFADYVMRGGFLGWDYQQPQFRPDFVHEARAYVAQHSENAPANCYLNSVNQNELSNLEKKVLESG